MNLHTRNIGGAQRSSSPEPIETLAALADQLNFAFGEHREAVEEAIQSGDERLRELAVQVGDIEQRLSRQSRGGGGVPLAETWGGLVTRSPELTAFRNLTGRGRVTIPINTRAITTAEVGTTDRRPGIQAKPSFRPTLRSLIPVIQTGASSVEFCRETSVTNAAAVVSETALKPQSNIEYELVNLPTRTIAHWVKASKQSLDDLSALQSAIDFRLRLGLVAAEELEILLGDGTGQHLVGLISEASAYAPVSGIDTPIDAIAAAISQLAATGVEADGVVLNSSDWMKMTVSKDETEAYYAGGGPFGNAPYTLWGKPVVPTPSMPAGTFLTGSYALGCALFEREAPVVELSTEDGDNFVRNMVTIRGEERVALAIYSGGYFVSGTLA